MQLAKEKTKDKKKTSSRLEAAVIPWRLHRSSLPMTRLDLREFAWSWAVQELRLVERSVMGILPSRLPTQLL